uniref:Uncharacterized protein n=1 Tax=viral metagenome TaxID=1070528 RepID=A0A6C0C761_9ZZZZ
MYPYQTNSEFFQPNEFGTVNFYQPNIATPTLETVTIDNIAPVTEYPFNTVMDNICNVDFKLNDTIITITSTIIVSNKPILIECVADTLRVWNLTYFQNNVIGTKGNLYIDGYNLLDFDNNNVKSMYIYELKSWIIDIGVAKKITISGNNNKIYVNHSFGNDIVLKINGKNSLHIKNIQIHVRSLVISNVDGNIYFDSTVCDHLTLNNKGIGNVSELVVSLMAEVNIIGPSVVTLNKLQSTECKEMINGPGKIIWNVIG